MYVVNDKSQGSIAKHLSLHGLFYYIFITQFANETHTHTRLTALRSGLPGWATTRKVKPIWILLKQETVSGSGIHWVICKSALRSRQITMPAPHRSVFYRPDALPGSSCRPTNSVKALKENEGKSTVGNYAMAIANKRNRR